MFRKATPIEIILNNLKAEREEVNREISLLENEVKVLTKTIDMIEDVRLKERQSLMVKPE